MQCPVCKKSNHSSMKLDAEGFHEILCECETCGSSWSINRNLVEVVNDTQASSFMEGITETVECDDYCIAI